MRARQSEGVSEKIDKQRAAFDLALRDDYKGKTIVVIIPSFAERYLSTALFDGL